MPAFQAVATTVTDAERDGAVSHGIFRVEGWCKAVESGKIDAEASPVVTSRAPSVVHVDARRGVAPYALELGLPLLAEKARATGIGLLLVQDCFHFSALWHEIDYLARQGLVAMAFVNSQAFVAHPGGRRRVYGTNPMAFAWPRHQPTQPLVFDQASSAMARGEVQLVEIAGGTVGDGVGIDPDGNPTNDPESILAGAQLPFGAHKGASIALMVELLAAVLTGSPLARESAAEDNGDGGPTRNGEVVIALDPTVAYCSEHASSDQHTAALTTIVGRAEALFKEILADGGSARLPGDRRYANRRQVEANGDVVMVDSKLHDKLVGLAGSAPDSLESNS